VREAALTETTAYDEHLEGLRGQAEQAFAKGDLQSARQIWEAVLQLSPGDASALEGLERCDAAGSPPGAAFELAEAAASPPPESSAPAGADLDLDLDLDLELDTPAPSPAEQPAPASGEGPPAEDGSTTVEDLFMAAEELGGDMERYEPSEPPPTAAATGEDDPVAVDETEGEAAVLVARARAALKEGRLDEASDLAARAMMVRDDAPGAQELLDEIHERRGRDSGEAERLLTEATEDLGAGRIEQAVARLEAALEHVPGHPEVLDQLDKARELAEQATAEGSEAAADIGSQGDEDWSAMPAIPLVKRETAAASGPREPDVTPPPTPMRESVGKLNPAPAGLTGAPPGPPPAPPTAEETAPPDPPAAASPPPAVPPEAPSGPSPEPPAKEPTAPGRGRAHTARLGSVDRRTGVLVALLVAAALGAGGWYAWSWWNGGSAGADLTAPIETAAVSAGNPEEPSSGGSAAPAPDGAPGSAAEAAGGTTAQPRLSPGDVPALLRRADQLADAGRYGQALSVLEAAREADPGRFEVMDRLEQVRRLERERQDAMERIAEGRRLFEVGSYREALRLFYRIPVDYQPRGLDTWIANGWYNLGVQALQAGSLVEARRFLADSLELRSDDPRARRHQELIQRYRGRPKDEVYWAYVNRIEPRPLPEPTGGQ
jgi:tetratricopeptide (TPR) repeat protein